MSKFLFLFRILRFFLLLLILSPGFWISKGYSQEAQEAHSPFSSTAVISMDFKDASLKDILKVFSIQSGLNFIASQEIEDRTVTLYLDKVSVKEAMDKLFKANKLDYEYNEEAKIILVKKAEAVIETITKIFPLKYACVSASLIKNEISDTLRGEGEGKGQEATAGITAVIEKLLSEKGSVIEDARTNTLIITDIPSRIKIIEEAIKQLDVPVPQVMLEVEILDVNKNLVDELGFDFGENPLTLILPGGFRHGQLFITGLDSAGEALVNKGDTGALTLGSTYRALLDFLRTQTETRYLARPRILTMNNETAEIKIETNELIGLTPEYGGEDRSVVTGFETEREKNGISLRVTPQINLATGEIIMFICPKVAEASLSNVQPQTPMVGQSPYQDVEERVTKSLVKVRDGETVIVGGLIHKDRSQIVKKLPILGDIPIIGALFRHKSKGKDIERELLVFITPHIVEDISLPLAEQSSEILSSREQDIIY